MIGLSSTLARSFGTVMGSWGESFGSFMSNWGTNFGNFMADWGTSVGRFFVDLTMSVRSFASLALLFGLLLIVYSVSQNRRY